MKKIKEVKLKRDIITPESFIPKGTIGKITKYADYLGGELCKFTNGITDAIYQCKIRDTQDLPDWFDITYEPAFKVGDWVKVVRKVANCKFWINFPMDKAIGNIYKIGCIDNMGNCELKLCNDRYNFPPESLEPAEKPVEKKKVVYEIEYEEDEGGSSWIDDAPCVQDCLKKNFSGCKNLTVKKL